MVLIRICNIFITICKVLPDLTFAYLSLISSHSSLSVLFTANCFSFGSLEFDIFLCCKGQSNIKNSELWCQKVRSPFAFNFCRKYYHIWIPREFEEKGGYLENIGKWDFFQGLLFICDKIVVMGRSLSSVQFSRSVLSSVQFSRSVGYNYLWPQELQHARPPCPSPTPGVHSHSRPSSPWCHPAISSSVVPLSSCPQSLPASESFPTSQQMRWPKYWSFSFSIIPSKEIPGPISFRMDCLDLLAVQGTLKSLLQHHSSKASILQRSAFFTVQLSHPYMTTGKTTAWLYRPLSAKWCLCF